MKWSAAKLEFQTVLGGLVGGVLAFFFARWFILDSVDELKLTAAIKTLLRIGEPVVLGKEFDAGAFLTSFKMLKVFVVVLLGFFAGFGTMEERRQRRAQQAAAQGKPAVGPN